MNIYKITIKLLLITIISMGVQAINIVANGDYIKYDLSGRDGRDGKKGTTCQPGEDGQDGLNGDDAIIYYTDIQNLKEIELDTSGGRGGEAGKPGPRYNCDGYSTRAKDGNAGQYGYLYLVNSSQLLSKEVSTVTTQLKNVDSKEIVFSKNIWLEKSGTRGLLHEDSNVSDRHLSFTKVEYTKVKIVLSQKVKQLNLNNLSLSVRYKNGRAPGLELSSNNKKISAILDYKLEDRDSKKVLTLNDIIFKKDISATRVVDVAGSKLNTLLTLEDPSFNNQRISNTFFVTVYKYHSFIDRYVILGSTAIKKELISKGGNRVQIALGKAKIFKGELNIGQQYKIKISVEKSIGDSSISTRLESEFRVK